MLIVQKYGGSSVANAERVFNVAKRIMRTRMEGNDVVVVLSAQGKTTDGLIAKAKEINAKPSRREMDMLLSTGEQQSVALMAMAISAIEGLPFLKCMFETASAVATVGLTLGITPHLSTLSQLILIVLMFMGRVGGMTLVFATIARRHVVDPLKPEEKVQVG